MKLETGCRTTWLASALVLLLASAGGAQNPAAGLTNQVVPPPVPAVDATNALKRVHVYVSGKVQGVGFRDFTASRASERKLRGWVKNLRDGRVELVAEGAPAGIDSLLKAVKVGPPAASVTGVESSEEKPTGEFKRFERLN